MGSNLALQVEYTLIWSLIAVSIHWSSRQPLHLGFYVSFDLVACLAVPITLILYLTLMEPYFPGEEYNCPVSYSSVCQGKTVGDVKHFATAMTFLVL